MEPDKPLLPPGHRPTPPGLIAFRYCLGLAQMTGAAMALTLLSRTGINAMTLLLVLGTTALTALSRCLFWRRRAGGR
ncbi:MAG: hypothetical protein EPO40_27925 [Myxococcaceae bacterium]|nr:MAG: hypothetical protein EPO40_27925 [Myxococcaceae bacterium]